MATDHTTYVWLSVSETVQVGPATVMLVECPKRHDGRVDREQCKIGVQADRSVKILRKEVQDRLLTK